MELCEKLSRWVGSVSIWLGGFLLILNVSDIVMGVAMRYFFGAAPIWTDELARFSMVWMVLIGAAATFVRGEQMSIDFVVMNLPPWGKSVSRFVSTGVQVVVLVALVWLGWRNVLGGWKMKTMALGVPKAIPLMAVPIGMTLLLAAIVSKRGRSGGEERE